MGAGELRPGRYDAVVDRRLAALAAELSDRVWLGDLEAAEQPRRLAANVADVLARVLGAADDDDRLALVNALVARFGEADAEVAEPPRLLQAVTARADARPPEAPDIPLSQHDLLVNARGEPHLAAELKKELASADRVDLIVAFVRWYGVRLIVDELEAAIDRGVPVRLLTTTYTGSTERRALDELRARGVDIRVSYDTAVTRLHAKSWIFHRDSGFGSAYVGSSNLTRTAMLDGREWNVRLSQSSSDVLFDKVATAFEAQWESDDYEPYDPERFAAALAATAGRDDESALSGLELRPWPYQAEILDALTVEREVHGAQPRRRAHRQRQDRGRRARLPAPAGRPRRLEPAVRRPPRADPAPVTAHVPQGARRRRVRRAARGQPPTDRRAARVRLDPDPVAAAGAHGHRRRLRRSGGRVPPRRGRDLPAAARRRRGALAAGADRHAGAGRRPRHPPLDRRADRFRHAAVARPRPPAAQPLPVLRRRRRRGLRRCARRPATTTSRSSATSSPATRRATGWSSARCGGSSRTHTRCGPWGFWATVEHAHAMAALFNRVGWPAAAIDGTTPQHERERLIAALRAGELTTIFSRDVFNEGVDIPEVDTILLLRPTESTTVHLQQLGRGLRRHPDKDVCTVLDFVAQHGREYRFDLRLRAMTGISRRGLVEAAEEGFPYLSSGCHLELDRQAREWVIAHLKEAVRANRRALTRELVLLASQRERREPPALDAFLDEAGVELEDVAKAGGWATLRRAADLETRPAGVHEARLQEGVRRLLHVDDLDRLEQLEAWLLTERRHSWRPSGSAGSRGCSRDDVDAASRPRRLR